LEVNENKEDSNPIERSRPYRRRDAAAAVANPPAIPAWPKTPGQGRRLLPDVRRERATGLDRLPGTPQGEASGCAFHVEKHMQRTVHDYLKALEAGDAEKAASLFIPDGWVESPFLGRLPVRQFIKKVAQSSKGTKLTVHDVLVSAEGHLRAVAYYLYDWRLKDGSRVAFDCADVFNFDPSSGRIQSIVLVYDTHPVRGVVENKYP
jgi:ketosteroid isomerase-like protein